MPIKLYQSHVSVRVQSEADSQEDEHTRMYVCTYLNLLQGFDVIQWWERVK